MDSQQIAQAVAAVITKAPKWIRHDMAGTDAALRARAEESLAAMIVAALTKDMPISSGD